MGGLPAKRFAAGRAGPTFLKGSIFILFKTQQNWCQMQPNILALWFMAIFLTLSPAVSTSSLFHLWGSVKIRVWPLHFSYLLSEQHILCTSSQSTTLKKGNKNFKSLQAEIKPHFYRFSERVAFAITPACNSRLVEEGSCTTQQRTGRKTSQGNRVTCHCSVTPS